MAVRGGSAVLLLLAVLSPVCGLRLRHERETPTEKGWKTMTIPAPPVPQTQAAKSTSLPAITPNDPRDADFSADEHVLVPPPAPPAPKVVPKPGKQIMYAQKGNTIQVVQMKQQEQAPPAKVSPEEQLAAAEADEAAVGELPLGASGGTVTKGFCKDMLNKVAKKEAPYYLEGKFTGETRGVLVSQCSQQICGWAMQFATKVSECPMCPSDCNSPALYAQKLMASNNFEALLSSLFQDQSGVISSPSQPPCGTPKQPPCAGATGPDANDPRDPEFDDADTLIVAPTGPSALDKAVKQLAEGMTGMVGPANAPYVRRPTVKGGVTKGFCTGMLKSIESKEAPYFLEGKYTGETRTELISQCSDQVCNWAVSFGKLVTDCPVCPTSCGQPMSTDAMQTFLTEVLSRLEKAGETPGQIAAQ